jgi:hypothetical protein
LLLIQLPVKSALRPVAYQAFPLQVKPSERDSSSSVLKRNQVQYRQ